MKYCDLMISITRKISFLNILSYIYLWPVISEADNMEPPRLSSIINPPRDISLTSERAVHDVPFEAVQFRHRPDGGEGLQRPQKPLLQKNLDQAGLCHPGPWQRRQRQRGTDRTLTVKKPTVESFSRSHQLTATVRPHIIQISQERSRQELNQHLRASGLRS